jgi:hypothetical protein
MASALQAQLLIIKQWQDEGISPDDADSGKQTPEDVYDAYQRWLGPCHHGDFIVPLFG